jgi:hypothetical protein
MCSIIKGKVTSDLYDISADIELNIRTGSVLLDFQYGGKPVSVQFEFTANEKTIPWLEDIGQLMLDEYISKHNIQDRLDSLFEGGSEWKQE